MQSILIVGEKEKVREEAEKICRENKISRFDKEVIESEKAVGIEEIRKLQERLFLTPVEGKLKAVVLEAFFGMTTQSQNAFLKLLEEPPAHALILILTSSLDFVLPTILSRCSLINVEQKQTLTAAETAENLQIIEELKNQGVSNGLKIAQDNGKDREIALEFLEKLIISAESSVGNKKFEDRQLLQILKALQKTYTIIKSTNVNPRFALENLFLNF